MPLDVLKNDVSFFHASTPTPVRPLRAEDKLGPSIPFTPPEVNVASANGYNEGAAPPPAPSSTGCGPAPPILIIVPTLFASCVLLLGNATPEPAPPAALTPVVLELGTELDPTLIQD